MNRLILFLTFFYSFIIYSGPLDIEDIKKECLKKFETENSDEYTKCIKDEVNKNLHNKPNSD
tara:strand:- start:6828 stop:7013 length:186 start_codon:yes stop_codon:yes gene_type:complete